MIDDVKHIADKQYADADIDEYHKDTECESHSFWAIGFIHNRNFFGCANLLLFYYFNKISSIKFF